MRGSRAALIASAATSALVLIIPAAQAFASAPPVLSQGAPHSAHAQQAPPVASTAQPTWRVDQRLRLDLTVPPSENPTGYTFKDVEAVGPHDAWAVGTNGANDLFWAHPVLRHWHNGKWLTPRLPAWMNGAKPGGWLNELEAVGGRSPSNVWAMGSFLLVTETIDRAVHWNGHVWTRAALPSQGAFAPLITSVVSPSATDSWAFGCYCEASQSPYIAHLVRGHWRDVTPKNLPFGGIFTASVISRTNIWAVMYDANQDLTHLLHWNGVRWLIVRMPQSISTGANDFAAGGGILATSKGGVWLAGAVTRSFEPAVVHDLRGRWTITKVPAASELGVLVSDGHGGMWSAAQPVGNSSAQIWHFTGGRWRHSPDPTGILAPYGVTWMASIPGSRTVVGIGSDTKNEVLLSYP